MIWVVGADGTARRYCRECGDPLPEEELHSIRIHLDRLLAERGMTLTELSAQVGITVVNLSVLKNGRAKAIRFSTLSRVCDVLRCQLRDLITRDPADPA